MTETYKNRFGKNVTVTINHEQIHETGATAESKISISEVEKIYETFDYFFIKLKSGLTLIIPKVRISDLAFLTKELKMIADEKHIPFIEMQNWRWR